MTTAKVTTRRRSTLPVELRPEMVTAIVNEGETMPLELKPLVMQTGVLSHCDYSVRGLESLVAVQHKTLTEFLSCVGQDRERFEQQVQGLLAFPTRAIIVSACWRDLERGQWESRVTPQAALGTALGAIASGVPVVMVGSRQRAGQIVSRLLFLAARRRWREVRALAIEQARPGSDPT